MKTALVTGVALLALAAAGCGSNGRAACPDGGATAARHAEGAPPTRYLTGVSVTRTDCAEEISFAFEHGAPGYRISYEPAARAQSEDASGRHIPVAGSAFLVVRLDDAATARSDGSTLTRTYSGPRRVGGAEHVREVVKTGDFEAVVTWAIGLDGRRPFTVARSGDALVVRIG
ncbi:MAG TPA: hypothetical protein VFJ77_11890 [Gaiellaceae bacterium]|nr:hypothetical protein [Gaiellaceae bacterium]